MSDPARDQDARFSYGDYRRWPESERWELIEGQAWCMSPAPMTRHQRLSRLDTRDTLALHGPGGLLGGCEGAVQGIRLIALFHVTFRAPRRRASIPRPALA